MGNPKWDVKDEMDVNGVSKGELRIDSSIALIGKLVEQYNLEGKNIYIVSSLCFSKAQAKVFFGKGGVFVSIRVNRNYE